jgi:lipopolysaccharide export system protein LptA
MKLASAALASLLTLALMLPASAETPPQRTTLQSANAEFWSVGDETFFVFNSSPDKRVTLTGTNLKITCDHLEMTAVGIANKDAKTATLPTLEKFKYLLATGNVVIVQGDREARAGRAEVFPREDKVVLTEKPVVIDHGADATVAGGIDHSADQIARGSRITMLRGDRRVRIEDTELEGPSIKDLGFDKNQPLPAPVSPATSSAPAVTPPPQPTK